MSNYVRESSQIFMNFSHCVIKETNTIYCVHSLNRGPTIITKILSYYYLWLKIIKSYNISNPIFSVVLECWQTLSLCFETHIFWNNSLITEGKNTQSLHYDLNYITLSYIFYVLHLHYHHYSGTLALYPEILNPFLLEMGISILYKYREITHFRFSSIYNEASQNNATSNYRIPNDNEYKTREWTASVCRTLKWTATRL